MPKAEIATQQAMHTLRQLHAELAGKLIECRKEAQRIADGMKHVEAVMKLLQPDYSLRVIAVRRRKPNQWFKRGTVLRYALDALRTADRPLTAREVTTRMLEAKGVKEPPAKPLRDLTGAVQSSLRNHEGRGVTVVGQGMPARWRLKES